jgi:septum formation protein
MNPFLPADIQRGLVLASSSPRRREILEMLGFEFDVIPAGVGEDQILSEDPFRNAQLIAELKGVDVQRVRPRRTIISADTVVVMGGISLGKPAGAEAAAEMLRSLSGGEHEVITGMALIGPPNRRVVAAERTKVFFREIGDREIARYVETGEPFDKAGAYAIQGLASAFVERIEGCFFNVVGLPVALLFRMFESFGRIG